MKNEQIERLTRQLLDCGYHSGQIKQIINEAAERVTESGNLQDEIIAALEHYVEFSMKCRRSGNRSR